MKKRTLFLIVVSGLLLISISLNHVSFGLNASIHNDSNVVVDTDNKAEYLYKSRINESYLSISENTVTLGPEDSGNFTGIWVHGTGTLILNGCELNIVQDEGHYGEFNVTGDGSLSILGGSKIHINKGNFSFRGRNFEMAGDSVIKVTNITGGQTGDPQGYGLERDGRLGNNSVVEIISKEPITISGSEIYSYGGGGGNGAPGLNEELKDGGRGGEGGVGKIIVEGPQINIIENSVLKAVGGDGGKGGERAFGSEQGRGGDGAKGGFGEVIIQTKTKQMVDPKIGLYSSEINASGGVGGEASNVIGDELLGDGGDGGNTNMLIHAHNDITFSDCTIYSLGGVEGRGAGGDGVAGYDDLIMRSELNVATGSDTLIRISKDSFGIDCPSGENELNNVLILDGTGGQVRPFSERESVIIIKWDVNVHVIDDYQREPISNAEVEVFIKDDDDSWDSVGAENTDSSGNVLFENVEARKIKGNELGQDQTVRIIVRKHAYETQASVPLSRSVKKTMILKILSLEISKIYYRSALMGSDGLLKISESNIRGGQEIGGIIYINGTASLENAGSSAYITGVTVAINDGKAQTVTDTSQNRDWSEWSFILETAQLSGKGSKSKLTKLYDDETLILEFEVSENNDFLTGIQLPIHINQSNLNNPPYCEIISINDLEVDPETEFEVKMPPEKQTTVVIKGEYFDLDNGDRVSVNNVRLSVQSVGKDDRTPISNLENTKVQKSDENSGTWEVTWELKTANFQPGSYIMSIDVMDNSKSNPYNASDSDHFQLIDIPFKIILESPPSATIDTIAGEKLETYWSDDEDIHIIDTNTAVGEKRITLAFVGNGFHNDPNVEGGFKYTWKVLNKITAKEVNLGDKASLNNPTLSFSIGENEEYAEFEVSLKVSDSRSYSSAYTENNKVLIKLHYQAPPPKTKGFMGDIDVISLFITGEDGEHDDGDVLLIGLVVIYILVALLLIRKHKAIQKRVGTRLKNAKLKIEQKRRQEEMEKEKKKKKLSLAELGGRIDGKRYVAQGAGSQDYNRMGYGDVTLATTVQQGPSAPYPTQPQEAPAAQPSEEEVVDFMAGPAPESAPPEIPPEEPAAPVPAIVSSTPPPVDDEPEPPAVAPVQTTAPVTATAPTTTAPVQTTGPVTTMRPVTSTVVTTAPVTTTAPVQTTAPAAAPQQQTADQGNKCSKCGADVKPNWFICPNCKNML